MFPVGTQEYSDQTGFTYFDYTGLSIQERPPQVRYAASRCAALFPSSLHVKDNVRVFEKVVIPHPCATCLFESNLFSPDALSEHLVNRAVPHRNQRTLTVQIQSFNNINRNKTLTNSALFR